MSEGGTVSAEVADARRSPAGLPGQAVRFVLVGAVGAMIDYGSSKLLVALGVPDGALRALSFALGSTVAYLLNRRWTFASSRSLGEAARAAAVYSSTFVLVIAVFVTMKDFLPEQHTISWAVSQGIGTSCNFLLQRRFVFRR